MQVYSPRCPRSSGRLSKHPRYLQGSQVPSVSGSPRFTPHLETPFLSCPTMSGKAQEGVRDRLPSGARQTTGATPGTAPQLGGIRLG